MPTLHNLILTRAVPDAPPAAALPEGYAAHVVADVSDPWFARVDEFYTAHGFAAGWSARLLGCSGEAMCIVTAAGDVAAGAWIFRAPFYVDEIRRSFRPDRDADYYFGDLVAPAHRGKGLQRGLIAGRLGRSQQAKRRVAVAMTRRDIPASFANYEALGFVVAADLSSRNLGPLQIDQVRYLKTDRGGQLSREGLRVGFGIRLRRRR